MVHRKFQQWTGAGVLRHIWQRELVEYDAMEGVAWLWTLPMGLRLKYRWRMNLYPNLGSREKMRQWTYTGRRERCPLVTCRQRSQSAR